MTTTLSTGLTATITAANILPHLKTLATNLKNQPAHDRLVTIEANNGALTLTHKTHSQATTISTPNAATGDGHATVDVVELATIISKTLGRATKTALATPIDFKTCDNQLAITIDGVTATTSLSDTPTTQPTWGEETTLMATDATDLHAGINAITYAMDHKETGYGFDCLFITTNNTTATLLATDRFRMAEHALPITNPTTNTRKFSISADHVDTITKLIPNNPNTTITFSTATYCGLTHNITTAQTPTSHITIARPQPERNELKTSHLWPTTTNHTLTVDRALIAERLKRLNGLVENKNKKVSLTITNIHDTTAQLTITGNMKGDTNTVSATIPTTITTNNPTTAEGFTIGFNPDYLNDTLTTLTNDTCTLEFTSPHTPTIIHTPTTPTRHLIMPKRLHT